VARFRQFNIGKPNVHHDALEFPGGEIVLQLLASPRLVSAAERQKGVSLVR